MQLYKRQKNIRFVMLVFLFCCILQFHVYAQKSAEETEAGVTIASAVVEPEGTVEVSVFIKKNPGIMGMGLEVYYDNKLLKIAAVQAENSFKNGTFNYSSLNSNDGEIKILWSSTENIKEDGEFCRLTFQSLTESEDSADLTLSLLPDDTFNEKWENVPFETNDGRLQIKSQWTQNENVSNVIQAAEKKEGGKEELHNSIEKFVNARNSQKTLFTDLSASDQEAVAEDIISDLKKKKLLADDAYTEATVQDEVEFVTKLQKETDPETIYKAVDYAAVQKETMLQKVTEEEAGKLLQATISEYGTDRIEDIPADQRNKFLNRFLQVLQENGIEQSDFWMRSTSDEQFEAVTMLAHDLSGEKSLEKSRKEIERADSNYNITLLAGVFAVLLIVILIAIVIRKGKNGGIKNAKKKE